MQRKKHNTSNKISKQRYKELTNSREQYSSGSGSDNCSYSSSNDSVINNRNINNRNNNKNSNNSNDCKFFLLLFIRNLILIIVNKICSIMHCDIGSKH